MISFTPKKVLIPFFNSCFDKGQIKNVVSWLLRISDEKSTLDFLESVKYLGFHYATLAGISLGLDDLEIPVDKAFLISSSQRTTSYLDYKNSAGLLTSVEKSQSLIDTWNQTSDNLRQSAIQNFKTQNSVNPVYMMAFSGARGNVSQVRQLVAMRGLMADPQGAILEFPIQSNFREGLTITEYLISCYGARKGLVDTALRTATSGYLTRRLVDSAQHVVVSIIDCQTKRGIVLEGEKLEKRLQGRVLATSFSFQNSRNNTKIRLNRNQIITPRLARLISEKPQKILVRSPLTCMASTSICQFCYGWNLASGKLVHIGEAVGVIAAQSIGEPGTQLTMRTFHTGGVGVLSEQALKRIEAPYRGKILFLDSLPGKFIRTPYGRIAYMVRYNSGQPDRIILILQSLSKFAKTQGNEFSIREQDFPSGSLLFVKNGEIVQKGQLIGQASRVKLTKQLLPESSHPVYSGMEGQVFFESMPLLETRELSFNVGKETKTKSLEPRIPSLPPKRTLSKIGLFWVLAGSNQFEIQTTKAFLKIGDLVSLKSLLFKYHFFSSIQVQVKLINSISNQKLTLSSERTPKPFSSKGTKKSLTAFGNPILQIPVENIAFGKKIYQCTIRPKTDAYNLPKISSKLIFDGSNKSSNNFILFFDQNNFKKFQILQPRAKGQFCSNQQKLSFLKKFNQSEFSNLLSSYNDSYFRYPLVNFESELEQNKYTEFKNSKISSKKTTIFYGSNSSKKFLRKKLRKADSNITKNFQNFSIVNPYSRKIVKFEKNSSNKFFTKFLTTFLNKKFSVKTYLLQKNYSSFNWNYVPTSKTLLNYSSLSSWKEKNLFCERSFRLTGSSIEQICFPKHTIFVDLATTPHLLTRKSNQGHKVKNDWYIKKELISPILTKYNFFQKNFSNKLKLIYFRTTTPISYTKILALGLQWYQLTPVTTQKKKQISPIISCKPKNQKVSQIVKFQLLKEYSLIDSQLIKKQWYQYFGPVVFNNILNPTSIKQSCSVFKPHIKVRIKLHNDLPIRTKWSLDQNLHRIQILVLPDKALPKIHSSFKLFAESFERGFQVFFYKTLTIKNPKDLNFYTYRNNWINPSQAFAKTGIKAKNPGEISLKTQQSNATLITTLGNHDLYKLIFPATSKDKIGRFLRWGDKLDPGTVSTYNGQIINITATTITIRTGICFLASARGVVHVIHNELVSKNQLLVTLKSRRLQTEDIVQGIPKIEQLFEARESQGGQILLGTVHTHLREIFLRELENFSLSRSLLNQTGLKAREQAVELSIRSAQQFLITNIIEAYGNQGVVISEKHVEVIVRQMTNRVRVVNSGQSGLLPGELVIYDWLQTFNKYLRNLGLEEATYEPIVLGISKSVLQSDSFLLAASFQEVSRVLVRSALSKKRDFLNGLHENVIVGQLIPAGTGLSTKIKS